jgi:hypothetical protein
VYVSLFPIKFIIEKLIQVGIRERRVESIESDKVSEIEAIGNKHEYVPASVGVSKGHVGIKVGFRVRRFRRFVAQEARIHQVTAADEGHVP